MDNLHSEMLHLIRDMAFFLDNYEVMDKIEVKAYEAIIREKSNNLIQQLGGEHD